MNNAPFLIGAAMFACGGALTSYYRRHAHPGPHRQRKPLSSSILATRTLGTMAHDPAHSSGDMPSVWTHGHTTPGMEEEATPASPWPRRPSGIARHIPQRLREGHPTLADQAAFRLSGLAAFACFGLFLRWLCQLQITNPQAAASPMVLLACLGAVIMMHLGSALTFIGPELVHEVEQPTRRFYL